MKAALLPALFFVMLSSCGPDAESTSSDSDTMSAKDSLKKEITENLSSSTGIEQFEWIYSSFVAAATKDSTAFNVFINKETGLWLLYSHGAMPEMKNVKSIGNFALMPGRPLIPLDRDKMICTPKEGPMPTIDCDVTSAWNKTGCFTSETNTFKSTRVWDYAGLSDQDSKNVEELAGKITRVVINTEMNMVMHFTLTNGTWYLTFLDLRIPCSA